MARDFQVFYHVRSNKVSRQKKESCRGLLGVYWFASHEAHVFLAPHYRRLTKKTGSPVPEDLLIREIIETTVHETLHSLILSTGPNAADREHRAISRLMAASGMDWRY